MKNLLFLALAFVSSASFAAADDCTPTGYLIGTRVHYRTGILGKDSREMVGTVSVIYCNGTMTVKGDRESGMSFDTVGTKYPVFTSIGKSCDNPSQKQNPKCIALENGSNSNSEPGSIEYFDDGFSILKTH